MAGDTTSADELLVLLDARPEDHDLRRRAAEALADAGRRPEALATLAPLINFTGHDDDGQLPCLCKTCLAHAPAAAAAGGIQFHAAFAAYGRHVLHYWTVDGLADQAEVRRSVTMALGAKLRERSKR